MLLAVEHGFVSLNVSTLTFIVAETALFCVTIGVTLSWRKLGSWLVKNSSWIVYITVFWIISEIVLHLRFSAELYSLVKNLRWFFCVACLVNLFLYHLQYMGWLRTFLGRIRSMQFVLRVLSWQQLLSKEDEPVLHYADSSNKTLDLFAIIFLFWYLLLSFGTISKS